MQHVLQHLVRLIAEQLGILIVCSHFRLQELNSKRLKTVSLSHLNIMLRVSLLEGFAHILEEAEGKLGLRLFVGHAEDE